MPACNIFYCLACFFFEFPILPFIFNTDCFFLEMQIVCLTFIIYSCYAVFRGASVCNADVLVTGHNADDNAETVLLNLLRGDVARLQRSTDGVTGNMCEFFFH